MALPEYPEKVQYFIAVLWRELSALEKLKQVLPHYFGSLDFVGNPYPFDLSDYYLPEMGDQLQRSMISFLNLENPDFLVQSKLQSNEIENQFSKNNQRSVNIDIGYLDHNKVVLASCKNAGQKIYLSQGIYADLILRYKARKYHPFEWSFLDFKEDRYQEDLLEIRKRYLRKRKNML